MKPFLMFMAFCCSLSLVAQNKEKNQPSQKKMASLIGFSYLVGSSELPGYEPIECSKNLSITDITVFPNGRSAPILQCYVMNKKQYSILENTIGQKTKITDIKLFETKFENKETLLFIVSGITFSMAFTLERGFILDEDDNMTIFYTKDVGKWKIYKK